jgi:hypothetical protein
VQIKGQYYFITYMQSLCRNVALRSYLEFLQLDSRPADTSEGRKSINCVEMWAVLQPSADN